MRRNSSDNMYRDDDDDDEEDGYVKSFKIENLVDIIQSNRNTKED